MNAIDVFFTFVFRAWLVLFALTCVLRGLAGLLTLIAERKDAGLARRRRIRRLVGAYLEALRRK